ncbi:hypothetical protein HOD20_06610 [archaeon]|jgi:hypothetical protein|nr:hypothetical protein [archaeon]
MNIQKVKQGARITYFNGIYMILLGLFFIFYTNKNMKQNFLAIDQLWGFFTKFNPEIAELFILFSIIIGILLVSAGIIITFLSDFIIKRKDKMTWVMLFIIGIIDWVGLLIITILLKNYLLVTLSIIGWIIFVIGMILPIQYYLQKNYREY